MEFAQSINVRLPQILLSIHNFNSYAIFSPYCQSFKGFDVKESHHDVTRSELT
jgi:hypothetical protein